MSESRSQQEIGTLETRFEPLPARLQGLMHALRQIGEIVSGLCRRHPRASNDVNYRNIADVLRLSVGVPAKERESEGT